MLQRSKWVLSLDIIFRVWFLIAVLSHQTAPFSLVPVAEVARWAEDL
jgi:hypothetical protein